MAAGTYTPTQAGEGPSMLGIAKAIGAKIRDAAEQAKEEREKADKDGAVVEKGSLFKSALKNQFNPVKSKKSKSNWSNKFSWNQKKSDSPVTAATQQESKGNTAPEKLKNFIAGGFSAIIADTTNMVGKLSSMNSLLSENVTSATRSADTLTIIKETLSTQTDLRRKALEEARYSKTEKELDKTKDVADVIKKKKSDKPSQTQEQSEKPEGGGMFDWLWKGLEIIDVMDDLNDLRKGRNPFGRGGPRVTTGGGTPKVPGGNWLSRMNPFSNPGIRSGLQTGMKGATGIGGRLMGMGKFGLGMLGRLSLPALGLSVWSDTSGQEAGAEEHLKKYGTRPGEMYAPQDINPDGTIKPGATPKFSEGGIVPSAVPPSPISPMADGGVVDNPTKTILNPGDAVLPLDSNPAKKMLGAQNAGDSEEAMAIPFKGAAAAFLGITSRMLGKTDSGIAGQMVAQDISRLSRQFGFANVLTTTSLGKATYTKADTEKESKNFLKELFSGLDLFGLGTEEDTGGGGGPSPTGATVTGGTAPGEGQFTMTSPFGSRTSPGGVGSTDHQGIDYSAPQGTPIGVLKPGKVSEVVMPSDPATMAVVRITHDDGTASRYGHLSEVSVTKDQTVGAGQLIGKSGGKQGTPGAGPSTGPHVHFEYFPSTSAPPADGSGVAKQYFTLGGTVVGNPSPQPMTRDSNAKGGNVAVIALGTNDWGVDSSIPQRNTQRIVKHVKDKGYNPVVIPPFNEGKFKKPREGVVRGARLAGAPVVNMSGKPDQYGHNSKSDRQRLGRMFNGALMVGDSNAVGIKYFSPKSRLIGGVGKDTDKIWLDVKNSGLKPIVTPRANPSPAPAPSGSQPSPASAPTSVPRPSRPPSSSGATRQPQPSGGVQSSSNSSVNNTVNTIVAAAPTKTSTATAITPFGANVPAGPTTAFTFADFLYPDLV